MLLLAAAQGPRVLLLPAAGQTAQSRGRVLRLVLMLLVLLLMLGLVRMLWLLMLLIDHNIIVVSVQQLRGQGHPPHGHHLVTSAAPEEDQCSADANQLQQSPEESAGGEPPPAAERREGEQRDGGEDGEHEGGQQPHVHTDQHRAGLRGHGGAVHWRWSEQYNYNRV